MIEKIINDIKDGIEKVKIKVRENDDKALVAKLFKAVAESTTLKSLEISGIYNQRDFLLALNKNNSIIELNFENQFDWNPLKNYGTIALFKILEKKNIEVLHLENHEITDIACNTISNFLKTNKTLKVLNLAENAQISPKGAKLIFDALKVNRTLKHLDISGVESQIKEETLYNGKPIMKIIRYNDFLNNLAEALKVNNVIEKIELAGCLIDDIQVKPLADALEVNKSIKFLNLSNNFIGSEGANKICEKIQNNYNIFKINLEGNSVYDVEITDDDEVSEFNSFDEDDFVETPEVIEEIDQILNRNKSIFNDLSYKMSSVLGKYLEVIIPNEILYKILSEVVNNHMQIIELISIYEKSINNEIEKNTANIIENISYRFKSLSVNSKENLEHSAKK